MIEEKLKQFKKKTILREKLHELVEPEDYYHFYKIIMQLVENDVISGIESSGKNGNIKYPIYNKYRISNKEKSSMFDTASLHPILIANGYLKNNLDKFVKYQDELYSLSNYYYKNIIDRLKISRKERSFEIFSDEKKFEDNVFSGLLKRIGITKESLNYFDTFDQGYLDFIPIKKERLDLLILENKDVWYDIRKVMIEDKKQIIFGKKIDGIVYGQGNAITQEKGLTAYTEVLNVSEVNFFYWGDIDKAGIDIVARLISKNMNVSLFVEAYNKMLQLSIGKPLPISEDARNIIYKELRDIDFNYQSRYEEIIQNNYRLPQEIITYKIIKEEME